MEFSHQKIIKGENSANEISNFIRASGRLIDEDNDFAKEYFKVANKNNKNANYLYELSRP